MVNMRTVMPALQKAKPVKLAAEGLTFASVSLPKQLRETKIVKDKSPDDIAREIVEWIKKYGTRHLDYLTHGNHSLPRTHRSRWLARQARARSTWRGQDPDRRPGRLEAGRRLGRRNRPARRRPHRQPAARRVPGRHRRGLRAVALRHAMPRRPRLWPRPRRPRSIVAPATSRWNRVLPGVAQRLGGRADTHVTGLSAARRHTLDQPLVLSPAHGGRRSAHPAAVVHPRRSRQPARLARRRRHGQPSKPSR